MKNIKILLTIASLITVATAAQAAGHAAAPMVTASVAVAAKTDLPMTEGEIRKVDLESKKVTIKHGEIKNLDMPGMTMVFQVKDPAMLDKIKAGDKVKFSAEKSNGAIVVTDIQSAAAPMATAPAAAATKTDLPMTEGEIRKVDLESKKITIKHGEIKNLDMPGMTMVFQVKDPAMLDKIKAGDKVKFSAEKSGRAIFVTAIQPVK